MEIIALEIESLPFAVSFFY